MEGERGRGRKRLKMTEMLREEVIKKLKTESEIGVSISIWNSQIDITAYNGHTPHMFVSSPVYVYTLINDGKYLIQIMSRFTNNNPEEIFLRSSVFPLTSKLTCLQQTNMFIMNPYISVQFKRLFM